MKTLYRFSFLLGAILSSVGLFAQPADFDFPAGCSAPLTNGYTMIGIVTLDGGAPPAGAWIAVFNASDEIVGSGQVSAFEFPSGSGTTVNGFSIRVQDAPGATPCPFHAPPGNLTVKYHDPITGVLTDVTSPFAGGVTSGIVEGPDGAFDNVDIYAFDSSLPVSLSHFSAVPRNGSVDLNWTTTEETDNSHFEIERSSSATSGFVNIGKVLGNDTAEGINNYDFTDENPAEGVNYYRLRQVDFDGTETPSPIVVVEMEVSAERKLSLFPNPVASNGRLTIRLGGDWAKGATNIRLVDVAGRLVTEWTNVNTGSLNTELPTLAAGIYQLIASDDRERKAVRLMVR